MDSAESGAGSGSGTRGESVTSAITVEDSSGSATSATTDPSDTSSVCELDEPEHHEIYRGPDGNVPFGCEPDNNFGQPALAFLVTDILPGDPYAFEARPCVDCPCEEPLSLMPEMIASDIPLASFMLPEDCIVIVRAVSPTEEGEGCVLDGFITAYVTSEGPGSKNFVPFAIASNVVDPGFEGLFVELSDDVFEECGEGCEQPSGVYGLEFTLDERGSFVVDPDEPMVVEDDVGDLAEFVNELAYRDDECAEFGQWHALPFFR